MHFSAFLLSSTSLLFPSPEVVQSMRWFIYSTTYIHVNQYCLMLSRRQFPFRIQKIIMAYRDIWFSCPWRRWRIAKDLSLTETRRSLPARLDDLLVWDCRSVLVSCELQTAPRQLIEIDNGEPRLGGSPRQGLHSVERCPGAPEPVARAFAPAADARSSFTRDSGSGLLSHPRTTHRSVTSARELHRFLPEVPDDLTRD